MAAPRLYYPHAILLPDTTLLNQFEDLPAANNYADLAEYSASEVAPSFTGSHSAAPALSFTTTQIGALLEQLTVEDVAASLAAGNCDVFYRRGQNLGSRVAAVTTSHLRCRMASNAFLSWESLSVRDGALAEAQARILPVWDETNAPMQWTDGVALSGADNISELYTLGPLYLNGTLLEGVGSLDWQNNIEYEEIRADGKGFIVYAAIKRVRPVVTFDTTDRSVMATYGPEGTALTSLQVFLRKKQPSGINVDVETEEHIMLTSYLGTIKADNAAARVQLHLRQFAIDTEVAIEED